MNFALFYLSLHSFLGLAAPDVKATAFTDSYQATYSVSRGGKAMAVQATTLQAISPNQYTLTDITKGTHGLASFTGFERTETSHFQIAHEQIIAVEHNMQQKVAFQRKSFQFKALANNNTIVGHEKQAFTLETTVKPISSHMLPLWLSAQVCRAKKQHNKQISIPVLKSKRIKTYQFLIFNESHQFFRLERIYPANTQRSSEIWLDKNKNCLPTKTLHREADEPVIETKLLTHNIIKANNLKNSSAK